MTSSPAAVYERFKTSTCTDLCGYAHKFIVVLPRDQRCLGTPISSNSARPEAYIEVVDLEFAIGS
jgi:hypothetical protein